jgi:hypothetical protein
MFLLPSFNCTTTTLNRGNATLNKEVSPFSDTGDRRSTLNTKNLKKYIKRYNNDKIINRY